VQLHDNSALESKQHGTVMADEGTHASAKFAAISRAASYISKDFLITYVSKLRFKEMCLATAPAPLVDTARKYGAG
jgi:hypothetical protein